MIVIVVAVVAVVGLGGGLACAGLSLRIVLKNKRGERGRIKRDK